MSSSKRHFPLAGTLAGTLAAPFAATLIAWQRQHGRNDLPWQNTRDAYRIWLSEIMLQQTQVSTVLPYFQRFLERFPDVKQLAAADLDEVLQLWSGLGYYSRARNLHRAAQQVVAEHGGRFPQEREVLETLPGIGRSTAAAIAAFAYGRREAILDGNVKRVLARYRAVEGFPGDKKVADRLWALAETLLPDTSIEPYTQGLMDLGATLCTRTPDCARCPVRAGCAALAQGAVASYPAPRPKRINPTRQTGMLLLVHRGRVLLRQRPPTGLWGGLWVFPEMDGGDEQDGHSAAARLGCELDTLEALPPLRHAFTHLTLDITPLLGRVKAVQPAVNSGGNRWLGLEEALAAAVPTPVRTLLERVQRKIAGEV